MRERAAAVWRHKRWLVIGLPAVFVVIAAAGFGGWLLAHRGASPIPATDTAGLDFAVYYPTKLPAGYRVDKHSFERRDDVLIYNISSPGGRTIAVSQQKKPDDATAPSIPDKTYKTAIGGGFLGTWGTNYVSDIVTTTGTWIIMNVNSFTADEALRVSQSFTQLP